MARTTAPIESAASAQVHAEFDSRLCELEMRLAHLSRFVEDLNEVLTEQAARLEHLERENAALRNRLAGPATAHGPSLPGDPD